MSDQEVVFLWVRRHTTTQDTPSPTKSTKRLSAERKTSPYQSSVNAKLKSDWLNKAQGACASEQKAWPGKTVVQSATSKLQQKLLQQVQSTEKVCWGWGMNG